jgi:hypothetical protein
VAAVLVDGVEDFWKEFPFGIKDEASDFGVISVKLIAKGEELKKEGEGGPLGFSGAWVA